MVIPIGKSIKMFLRMGITIPPDLCKVVPGRRRHLNADIAFSLGSPGYSLGSTTLQTVPRTT